MWYHVTTIAIGGLENIGFADSGNVIILSNQGRGIVSGTTGEKVFRDNKGWWEDFKEAEGTILGFGGELGSTIELFGIHTKSELRKSTKSGWWLVEENGHHKTIPIHKFYLKHNDLTEPIYIGEDGPCELRAYGFSKDEQLLVIATSCELVVWGIRKDNKI